MGARPRKVPERSVNLWPVYEVPRDVGASPFTPDSGEIVRDMAAVLAGNPQHSTTEALALLRQTYPQYPLALRLAAVAAHMKHERTHAALSKLHQELSDTTH